MKRMATLPVAIVLSGIALAGCSELVPPERAASDGRVLTFAVAEGSGFAATPITPDANTVILDHFDGATTGNAVGALGFAMSLDGLGQAGVFGVGNYIQYPFSGWSTGQGTVEMWIRPNSLTAPHENRLLNINWNNTGSFPSAGHVLHFFISTSNGDVAAGGFWPGGGAQATTPVPVGLWTHLALSWGPAGTRIYVDGNLEADGTPGAPSLITTNYGYLNYWGTFAGGGDPFDGLIDEFHLSKIQRSDEEIAGHAALRRLVMQVAVDIKPGSDPNSINCMAANAVIPVAILTTDDFDATTVDHTTVTFGPDGAMETHVNRRTGEPQRHEEDVDGDGDTDLVLHFRNGDTGLGCDATDATLTGETFDGTSIEGTDAVRMVP